MTTPKDLQGLDLAELKRLKAEVDRIIREQDGCAPLELLDFQQLMEKTFPNPRWLIDGLLPAEGISVLFGLPGARKTWLATHAALCIGGNGDPFLGQNVVKGKVLMLMLEGGVREHQRRLRALKNGNPCEGTPEIVSYASGLLDLDDDGQRRQIAEEVDRHKPAIAIVDNLRLGFGGDEDDSEQSRNVRMFVDEMRARHDSAWWFLHHPIKGVTGPDPKSLRGTGGHWANLDSLLFVDKRDKSAGTVYHQKTRGGIEYEPIHFEFHGPADPEDPTEGATFTVSANAPTGPASDRANAADDARTLRAHLESANGEVKFKDATHALGWQPYRTSRAADAMEAEPDCEWRRDGTSKDKRFVRAKGGRK